MGGRRNGSPPCTRDTDTTHLLLCAELRLTPADMMAVSSRKNTTGAAVYSPLSLAQLSGKQGERPEKHCTRMASLLSSHDGRGACGRVPAVQAWSQLQKNSSSVVSTHGSLLVADCPSALWVCCCSPSPCFSSERCVDVTAGSPA